jgi:hypothetical protein
MSDPSSVRQDMTRRDFVFMGIATTAGLGSANGVKAGTPVLPGRGLCAHRGAMILRKSLPA